MVTRRNDSKTPGICAALLLLAGCGGAASTTGPAAVATSVAVVAEPALDAEPISVEASSEPSGLANLAESFPFGIDKDEPFAEVKLFANVTLHMQRMHALQDRKLHTELKLTEAQVRKFTAHGDEVKKLAEDLPKVRPDERETTMLKVYVPKAEQFKALVEKELTPAQQQLVLQKVAQKQRGAIALLLPGVPEHLQMTDAQRTAIFKIVDDNRKSVNLDELNNLMELRKLMLRANAAREEAENQLTEPQRKQWQKLLGK